MLRHLIEKGISVGEETNNEKLELAALRIYRHYNEAIQRGDLADVPLDHEVVGQFLEFFEVVPRGAAAAETKKRGRRRKKSVPDEIGRESFHPTDGSREDAGTA